MATTQDHLDRFYAELQAWIEDGMPTHDIFTRTTSICRAAMSWQGRNVPGFPSMWLLWNAIGDQFEDAGLHRKHPFNDGSFTDWKAELDSGRGFDNPARLAWIKQHAEAAKAAGQAVPA